MKSLYTLNRQKFALLPNNQFYLSGTHVQNKLYVVVLDGKQFGMMQVFRIGLGYLVLLVIVNIALKGTQGRRLQQLEGIKEQVDQQNDEQQHQQQNSNQQEQQTYLDFNDLHIQEENSMSQQNEEEDEVQYNGSQDIVQLLHNYVLDDGQPNPNQPQQVVNRSVQSHTSLDNVIDYVKHNNVDKYAEYVLRFSVLETYQDNYVCDIQDALNLYNQQCDGYSQPCLYKFQQYVRQILFKLQNYQVLSGTFFIPHDAVFDSKGYLVEFIEAALLYHLIPAITKINVPSLNNDYYSEDVQNGQHAFKSSDMGENLVYDNMVIPLGPLLNNSLGNVGDLVMDTKGGVKLWGSQANILVANLQICSLTVHIVDDFLLPHFMRQKLEGSSPEANFEYPALYLGAARAAVTQFQQYPQQQQQAQSPQYISQQDLYPDQSDSELSIPMPPTENNSSETEADEITNSSVFQGMMLDHSYDDLLQVQTINAGDIGIIIDNSTESPQEQYYQNTQYQYQHENNGDGNK
eukprot:TRINITY_DN3456_c0_g3_i2.p1 TRINITY_DN3456_c0_g3~~TRINITY_DN3456_c0_g3_i2.p1  ORF type:complete len:517 (-),score=68.41 TRINITY_DN3456_c0_g3_i2:2828-4378(-)